MTQKGFSKYDLTMRIPRSSRQGWRAGFRWAQAAVLAAALLSSGCGGSPAEDRDPNIRRARLLKNAGNYEEAVAAYEKALRRKPQLARAHWELATLYDQQFEDDVSAIYHYRKYLELEPDAERRDLVEDLISVARVSFAASLPRNADETIREVRRLQRENAALAELLTQERNTIRDLRAELGGRPPEPGADPGVAPATGPDAGPAPMPPLRRDRSYVVQPGDTLSRIAGKVYANPARWDKIFEANRDTLRSPESIRVGQTLRIPPDEP